MNTAAAKKEMKKSASCRKTKAKAKASAAKPIITKLYDGTADLIIKIPQTSKKNTGKTQPDTNTPDTEKPPKELIEITLPPAAKTADNSDRIAALASALISALLKDIETAKQTNRKTLQAEGIARAKAEGKRFGRESITFDAELFEKLSQAYKNNEISASEAGKQLGCSSRTFQRRYAQQHPEEKKEDKIT